MDSTLILIILAVLVVLYFVFIYPKFKVPKVGSMVACSGGVKSGKTTFSFYLAYKTWKRNVRRVKFRNFFARLFKKEEQPLPLFYSTIPVAFPHVIVTRELMTRQHRFVYGSVIFVDEASLFADSLIAKTMGADINDRLLMFNKLIAHELKAGGTIIYNSQQISDLHVSIRRCLSETFYVHSTFKWLPFFMIATVREERYAEDGTIVNTYENDVEDHLKKVIIPKKVWKMFDCYCYSILTDNKPVDDRVIEADTLKAKEIISFNPRHCFKYEEEEKKEVEENAKENG